jgi:hypothetical protein
MSAKPMNEDAGSEPAKTRTGEFLHGLFRSGKPSDDGLHFIFLEDARVSVALPRGRKLTPIDRQKARNRWSR